jgi:serine/threonine protein phosphatase 1
MLALSPADTLVFVGDIVDRGPATQRVIDKVLSLSDTCNVVVLMGNHEEMMRDALSGRGVLNAWLDVGGRETLESYGGIAADVPPEHIRFLLSAQPYWETETDIFVHASVESGVSLPNQTAEFLRWKHVTGSELPHRSGKRIICGHTAQKDGRPFVFDGWACIDTYAYGGKYLSCLDVNTGEVFQASETGETRRMTL